MRSQTVALVLNTLTYMTGALERKYKFKSHRFQCHPAPFQLTFCCHYWSKEWVIIQKKLIQSTSVKNQKYLSLRLLPKYSLSQHTTKVPHFRWPFCRLQTTNLPRFSAWINRDISTVDPWTTVMTLEQQLWTAQVHLYFFFSSKYCSTMWSLAGWIRGYEDMEEPWIHRVNYKLNYRRIFYCAERWCCSKVNCTVRICKVTE